MANTAETHTRSTNPVLVEVTRGGIVESRHRGAYAIAGDDGRLIKSAGDIKQAVFPRSAIKAFQAMPLLTSGAAQAFGLDDAQIALCCSSHNGEPEHVKTARSILAKAGVDETALSCGVQWPRRPDQLIRRGQQPGQIHNNCSGKHAGMLALARYMNLELDGYWRADHPLQQLVRHTIEAICRIDLSSAPVGIDGCSLPTWGFGLAAMATGFARFSRGAGLDRGMAIAAERIIAAVRANPFMVAGTDRFCTRLMQAVPRAFVKTGAEGVFCGCVPHAGIAIALKCDDGNVRASEPLMAGLLAGLDVWRASERAALEGLATIPLTNWRGIRTGEIRLRQPDCR